MDLISKAYTNCTRYVTINNNMITLLFLQFLNLSIFSFIYYFYFKNIENWSIIGFKTTDPHNIGYTDALYFSAIAATSVGFGDMSPKGDKLRFLIVLQITISLFIIPNIIIKYNNYIYIYIPFIVVIILLFLRIIYCKLNKSYLKNSDLY